MLYRLKINATKNHWRIIFYLRDMPANSFGEIFRLTTFGESHGSVIGGAIDGCPSGLALDTDMIQLRLDQRKPGQSEIVSQRSEADIVEILSGVFEGVTTGASIGLLIKNKDQNSRDYDHLIDLFRPSHADFTYNQKYGHRDHRGGGRASARETAIRVAAGAVAEQFINHSGIKVHSWVDQIGDIKSIIPFEELDINEIYSSDIRCPDEAIAIKMNLLIHQLIEAGDTIGGTIKTYVQGMPVGLGAPVYDRLEADLAKAMLSINASKGFEIGGGFEDLDMRGSEMNDQWVGNSSFKTKTNHSGGVQGGISNGMPLEFRTAFKAVSTLMQSQKGINHSGEEIEMLAKGRHDPCVLPRAVPVVKAMTELVIADHLLRNRTVKL